MAHRPVAGPGELGLHAAGNLTRHTDRKGQVATYRHDTLNRMTFAGFGASDNLETYTSTIDYTYDDGDRLSRPQTPPPG